MVFGVFLLPWLIPLPSQKTFVFFSENWVFSVILGPGGGVDFPFLQNWSWKTPFPVVDWEQQTKNITHGIKV